MTVISSHKDARNLTLIVTARFAAGAARCVVTLEEAAGVTTMTFVATFTNTEQLQQSIDMGMEEGLVEAMGQIDAILAESVVRR